MKLLFENWRKYLNESTSKEVKRAMQADIAASQQERGFVPSPTGTPRPGLVITFDFDDTLTITRPDEDWGTVEVGPNTEIIDIMKKFIDGGAAVFIVTSRLKTKGIGPRDLPEEVRRSDPREYVKEHGLKLSGPVIYTNGALKAKTLYELGSDLHFDDDPEEIQACEDAGIKTHKVSVPHWEEIGISE